MKHADSGALARLGELLASLRARSPQLREKRPGIFYLKSRAFLHFHEDPGGLFADLRVGNEWQRFPVSGVEDQARLLDRVNDLTQTIGIRSTACSSPSRRSRASCC
jgi:hypothetical protein